MSLEELRDEMEAIYTSSDDVVPDWDDEVDSIVTEAQAILEWLALVEPHFRRERVWGSTEKLRSLCDRIIEETATLVQIRDMHDLAQEAKSQFESIYFDLDERLA